MTLHSFCPCQLQRGDPRFYLWLPLSLLLPGSSWLERAWCAARIAVKGFWAGLLSLLPVPLPRALFHVWTRCLGPWGALPVDLAVLKSSMRDAE